MPNCAECTEMERIWNVVHDGNVGADPLSVMYGEMERVIERHLALHREDCRRCLEPEAAPSRYWEITWGEMLVVMLILLYFFWEFYLSDRMGPLIPSGW